MSTRLKSMIDFKIILPQLISVVVIIIGWFVSFYLARSKDIELRKIDKNLAYIKSQIDEFYGPIYGLRKQCKLANRAYRKLMPKDDCGNIDKSKISDEHMIFHDFIAETYLIPTNNEISKIIRNKIHLLDSSELPDSFIKFLEHQVQFECYYRFKKDNKLDTYDILGTIFPEEFDHNIESTLNELRQKYNVLINKNSRNK